MITIHHLDQSRSFRVVWMMEELGLPYDLVCHKRGADMRAPESLRKLHPLGKSPVICDDQTIIFESGAIMEYVAHRYGHGRLTVPSHHLDYAGYLTWLHAAEGTCMPALMPVLFAAFGGPPVSDAQMLACETVLRLCDDTLAGREYFGGGGFTIADINMHTFLLLAQRFVAAAFGRYGRLQAYLGRVQERAAFARANEVVAPHEPPAGTGFLY